MKPDIKGLTKLARVLQHVPRKNFNIDAWLEKTGSCGTAGCIAGWAALTFPHRFKKTDEYITNDGRAFYEVVHKASGLRGEDGFAKAFKISEDAAKDLTLRNRDRKATPKAAARAVMALVGRLKKVAKK